MRAFSGCISAVGGGCPKSQGNGRKVQTATKTRQRLSLREKLLSEYVDRRQLLSAGFGSVLWAAWGCRSAEALPKGSVESRLSEAFNRALTAVGDPKTADDAWTDAINLDPTNAPSWSNRGTSRLQFGRWAEARADLEKALELETANGGSPNALLLNNLGNAKGATGDWQGAIACYQEAASDPAIESIALANLALSQFETGDERAATRQVRSILRRDPEFLDMRCALVAFLWASGNQAAAESEWSALQDAQDGLGGLLYNRNTALSQVKPRWPPRASAALDAFLSLSRTGLAQGYDGVTRMYKFEVQLPIG